MSLIQGMKKTGLLQVVDERPLQKRRRLLCEQTHLAILHALLVSYEVKMSILLCGIQPDKYVQME